MTDKNKDDLDLDLDLDLDIDFDAIDNSLNTIKVEAKSKENDNGALPKIFQEDFWGMEDFEMFDFDNHYIKERHEITNIELPKDILVMLKKAGYSPTKKQITNLINNEILNSNEIYLDPKLKKIKKDKENVVVACRQDFDILKLFEECQHDNYSLIPIKHYMLSALSQALIKKLRKKVPKNKKVVLFTGKESKKEIYNKVMAQALRLLSYSNGNRMSDLTKCIFGEKANAIYSNYVSGNTGLTTMFEKVDQINEYTEGKMIIDPYDFSVEMFVSDGMVRYNAREFLKFKPAKTIMRDW